MDLLQGISVTSEPQTSAQIPHPFKDGDDLNSNIPSDDDGLTPKSSVWSFEFYQRFFDVDTDEVLQRVKHSFIPQKGVNFLQQIIRSKPDLYGPFWISVTLIFTIAISGNLANYLQTAATQKYHWRYDFHAVSSAATAIFAYAWLLPLALWGYLKWNGQVETKLSILEVVCLYGYCLTIYIPVSILWVIQISWLQWFLVAVGALASGTVLVTSINSVLTSRSFVVLAIVFGFHILLAMGFMLYFFHVPSANVYNPPDPVVSVAPTTH